MPDGFTNKPKILRGAFVEYGLSIPPLVVPFQFNPVQLSRSRSLGFHSNKSIAAKMVDNETEKSKKTRLALQQTSLREFHWRYIDLGELREAQSVDVREESINFEIRLDATDKLNESDFITEQFGIAPQLATLELMVIPKGESIAAHNLRRLAAKGFSFTKGENPPMVLFIWGRKRVLPVNINNISITETEFSPDLNPIRATVSVTLTVIEGPNTPYSYSKAMKEVMAALNLANIADVTDVLIPI